MKAKILIILLVAVLGIAGWKLYEKKEADSNGLTLYGNVDTRTVTVGFRFIGKIDAVTKDEGQSVFKGEQLVFLDNTNMKNALAATEANIVAETANLTKLKSGYRIEEIQEAKAATEEAKAHLVKTKETYARQQRLIKSNATSKQNFDDAKAAYLQARATLDKTLSTYTLRKNGYRKEDITAQAAKIAALEADAAKLRQDLNDSVIVSPVNGVILTRYKEPGSVINPGEKVLEIAKSDELWVRAYVDEPNLGKIRPGETMLIFTDSRKKPYTGTIGFIAPIAEFTPKNVQTEELRTDLVYRFRVIVKNPDDKIRQGMPVTLKPEKTN